MRLDLGLRVALAQCAGSNTEGLSQGGGRTPSVSAGSKLKLSASTARHQRSASLGPDERSAPNLFARSGTFFAAKAKYLAHVL